MYISESSRAPLLRSFFLYRPICKFRINHYICIGVRGDSSELPLFYSSSKASGTSPECSRQKPIGRISGPLQSSKTEENTYILISGKCIRNKNEIKKFIEVTDYMGLIINEK